MTHEQSQIQEQLPDNAGNDDAGQFFQSASKQANTSASATCVVGMPSWMKWSWIVLLLAIGVTYYNSFRGQFMLDDIHTFVQNSSPVRKSWPITEDWRALFLQQRPLVNFTFAINYILVGSNPWGYHLANLVIHAMAALVLMDLLRRALLTPRLARHVSPQWARPLALTAAAIWALHPVQAQSVTYIIQRSESMMGLFYLLVIYCGLRSIESSQPRRRWWQAAAVAASCLGMCSKQVMVTAPLMMLLFDRVLLSRSFRQAIGRSWPMYLGLLASLGILAGIVLSVPAGTSAGFETNNFTWQEYLRTQGGVILHYLFISVLPVRLCLDLAWPRADSLAAIAIPWAIVLVLLLGTIWALVRRPVIGLAGAWFFLILAPTSSFMPIRDAAFEHRLYLSLAAIAAVAVVGGLILASKLAHRRGVPAERFLEYFAMAGIAAVVLLGAATISRNSLYGDPLRMWQSVVAVNDRNPRALTLLGQSLRQYDRTDEAIEQYKKALDIDDEYAEAWASLGAACLDKQQWEESLRCNERAIERHSDWTNQLSNIGYAYLKMGQEETARQWFQKVLDIDQTHEHANMNMGTLLMQQGQPAKAIVHFIKSIEAAPENVEAMYQLGLAYEARSDLPSAISQYIRANRIKETAKCYVQLGITQGMFGKTDEAIRCFNEAIRLAPRSAVARYRLGLAYASKDNLPRAIALFKESNEILPTEQCYRELGIALSKACRKVEAIESFRQALALSPQSDEANVNLALALESNGQTDEARPYYQKALALTNDERLKADLQRLLAPSSQTSPSSTQAKSD